MSQYVIGGVGPEKKETTLDERHLLYMLRPHFHSHTALRKEEALL
jgi:hypothetical protein